MTDSLSANYEHVRARVAEAAKRAGRDPAEISIIAVTKGVPAPRIREAVHVGLRRLGENRVQEALPKIAALQGEDCEWHLIGHLQTNKVRMVVSQFTMIQSIDSVRLVEVLAQRLHKDLDVLVEVNVAEELQKTGVLPAGLDAVIETIRNAARLCLRGLMTMAPQTSDPENVRPVFQRLRALRDQASQRLGTALPELSMGMTDDYPVAIEEGATMLRLGRALFGPR